MEYFVVFWIVALAVICLAPDEVGKVLLATGWAVLLLLTLAAFLWRGWVAWLA